MYITVLLYNIILCASFLCVNKCLTKKKKKEDLTNRKKKKRFHVQTYRETRYKRIKPFRLNKIITIRR